jgi:hypothetical protein
VAAWSGVIFWLGWDRFVTLYSAAFSFITYPLFVDVSGRPFHICCSVTFAFSLPISEE